MEDSYFCFLPFIWKSKNIYTVVTNEGNMFSFVWGSQFNSLGPVPTVPLALLISIFERYFKVRKTTRIRNRYNQVPPFQY